MIKESCHKCGRFIGKNKHICNFKPCNGKYLKCKQCGKSFYARPYRMRKRKYCSRECSAKSTLFKKGHHCGNRYKKGHIPWSKLNPELMPRGKNNHMYGTDQSGKKGHHYKNGTTIDNGYVKILKPTHPFCNMRKYVPRSRLVVEKYIERYLERSESVHHINGKKDDDRPENLMAFKTESAHQRFHKNPNNVKSFEIIFNGQINSNIPAQLQPPQ